MDNPNWKGNRLLNLRGNRLLSILFSFLKQYGLRLLIGLAIFIGIVSYTYRKFDSPTDGPTIQILCFLIAIGWAVYVARHGIQTLLRTNFQQLSIHPAWLLVLIAVILRYFTYPLLPPTNQTGFEEMQTGTIVYRMLLVHELPIEFRFTNLLGLIGFSASSGINLAALRFPYEIAGIISIILIVFCLRILKINWGLTLLITFMAATLRFLVIASGAADELFASIPFVAALLLCLIQSENSENNQAFWTASAGIFAGILMFEYTSYRVLVVFGIAYLLWKCFFVSKSEKGTKRISRWFNLFSFLLTLTLIALPTIAQTIRYPADSVFFEAFRRHGGERPTFIYGEYLSQIKDYILGLTGWPSSASAYYTPVGEPVILAPIGWLFGISLIFGLGFSSRGFVRGLALTVILMVISAGLTANNANIGRMAPALPLLLIMAGDFLDSVYIKLNQWGTKKSLGKEINIFIPDRALAEIRTATEPQVMLVRTVEAKEVTAGSYKQVVINVSTIYRSVMYGLLATIFIFLVWQITAANITSIKRMVRDPEVINEYVNDDYSVCAHIGDIATPGQRVYIYSPDGNGPCTPNKDEGWYFGGKQPEIHNVLNQPVTTDMLVSGDLVVFGTRSRELTREEIAQLIDLGTQTNSLTSLRFSRNLAGRITAASISIQ
jgi:hypothetical protein